MECRVCLRHMLKLMQVVVVIIIIIIMELSPSWEAANCAATQELSSILWNPKKVHHRVHKSPPLVRILSMIDLVHTTPSYLSKVHFNIITHLRLVLPCGLFHSGFPTDILYAFLFAIIRATCPVYLIFLDLIIQLCLARSINYEAPHYAIFSNLLSCHLSSVQIFSSAPCSQTPSVYVPSLMSKTEFRAYTEP
jgi:hypothetical protein